MSRLQLMKEGRAESVVAEMYRSIESRVSAGAAELCPVDATLAFVTLAHASTCGKCAPCRIGLYQLTRLLTDVLDGNATEETLTTIEHTAEAILASSDCAIGYTAGAIALKGIKGFRDDFNEHIKNNRCLCHFDHAVPCVSKCPAEVDIPGYIALIAAGRYDDAVRLIRKDNPFPTACAYICEHPCESRCRRKLVDDAVNIRGLKRVAVDKARSVPVPERAPTTGKRVAVIGGGPAGLTAAYYLSLMGHSVKVFEQREKLGGMLRYGIPSYRLPRERLDEEIASIISAGVDTQTGVSIGRDIDIAKIKNEYDALYIAIGAHSDKKLRVEGEDSRGVISAVDMLREIGDGRMPDFKGKNVVIVGGGNVAMDVTRSSMRLGAAKVTCVYRRRKNDMTALPEEVEGAIAEGCEIAELMSPLRIETDSEGSAAALWVQPQMISTVDRNGRPAPKAADVPEKRIPADIIIIAIGQSIDSERFGEFGIPLKWDSIDAHGNCQVKDYNGIFAGGDCVTGPATVIRAIAAGKVAAANIDEYLGFNHVITSGVEIPPARCFDSPACGRVNQEERIASARKCDFAEFEMCMSDEESAQEASRCLRCDHFGYGGFKGGRKEQW